MATKLRITSFINPRTKSKSYRLAGSVDGRRVRQNFKTEALAKAALNRMEVRSMNRDNARVLRITTLSEEQIHDAESARDHLVKAGLPDFTLTHVARFFSERYQPAKIETKLTAAIEEIALAKEAANRRSDTVRGLKQRLTQFANGLGENPTVDQISSEQIQAHLSRPNISPRTALNDRVHLHGFFEWAIRKGYAASNPVKSAERPKVDTVEPVVLEVEAVARLFRIAQTGSYNHKKTRFDQMIPYLTLVTFCGLRPTEARRLSWDSIDLAGGYVTISGAQAKRRSRRIVRIPPNALEWLLLVKKKPICPGNFRRIFDHLRQAAEVLGGWSENILRHSFVTYHLATSGDENATAVIAGNSPEVIHRYYRGLATKAAADRFWSIKPALLGKVIALPSAKNAARRRKSRRVAHR